MLENNTYYVTYQAYIYSKPIFTPSLENKHTYIHVYGINNIKKHKYLKPY